MKQRSLQHSLGASVGMVLIVTLTLPSCQSLKPPNQKIQSAEQAIRQAEQARVANYSSPELRAARDKLVEARSAIRQNKMIIAGQLAEQSRVEADLAVARSAVTKAREINNEIEKGIAIMQQEMQRNRGIN
ncbi:DUF4398 domain-containing protein [Aliikangiella sp. IMCC44359]|uniref:DUF4398 domain-containing protein n=1 Tax=Aliikangiella sp. IMCC44359 TaxID=3459125 RepID=UPI00403AAB76